MKTKIVSSQTADSKPVKQEVNSTVILPPLVFPFQSYVYDFYADCHVQGVRLSSAAVALTVIFADNNVAMQIPRKLYSF